MLEADVKILDSRSGLEAFTSLLSRDPCVGGNG